MKTYCLFIATFMLTYNCLFGEIRNGYEMEIINVRAVIKKSQ